MFQLKEDFSLINHNTFGLNVQTKYFITCNSVDDICDFISIHYKKSLPLMVLGGGSNVLFVSDFEGYILKPDIQGIEMSNETKEFVEIRVGAGEDWDELVNYCVEKDWGGIENLSLIPGNVGTSPIQNIGAYGVEVKDVITSVETIEMETLKKFKFRNSECEFAYRDSIFKRKLKGKHIITHVCFRLKKQPDFKLDYGNLKLKLAEYGSVDLEHIRKAVVEIRESKLPKPEDIGNAGSFFKNPIIEKNHAERIQKDHPELPLYVLNNGKVKIPAGWLIEKAGFKGKKVGNIGVHEKQALVIVNYGNATGEEILHLAKNIQQAVIILFEIELDMEVNIV